MEVEGWRLTVWHFGLAAAVLWWYVQTVSMEVGRGGNECVAFWACR